MSQQAPTSQPIETRRLELFEPAMCCSTGVCGPSGDTFALRLPAPSLSLTAQHLGAVAADRLDSHRRHGLIDEEGYGHADDVRHCRMVVEVCTELLARTGPAPAAVLRWATEMSV